MRKVVAVAPLVLLAAASLSRAQSGPPLRPGLDGATRADLARTIASARASQPRDFARVAQVRDAILRERQRSRGGRAPVALWLKPLGESAIVPLLEIVGAPEERGGDPTTAHVLRVAAVEALGSLRDARAAPVLRSLLASSADAPDLERAVVEALGRIGDDTSSALLAVAAEQPGRSQRVVLSAVGECRRLVVARALERVLQQPGDAERTRLAARALGELGSAWAWNTKAVARTGEGQAVRKLAARALVDLLVSQGGAIRGEARKGLLLVAHPSSPGLLRAAQRDATPALRAELEEVVAALDRSPIRSDP